MSQPLTATFPRWGTSVPEQASCMLGADALGVSCVSGPNPSALYGVANPSDPTARCYPVKGPPLVPF